VYLSSRFWEQGQVQMLPLGQLGESLLMKNVGVNGSTP
jgi:hypothetical protein